MNIVITGAESFIGRELRRQLVDRRIGWKGFDMLASGAPECVKVDIRSKLVDEHIPEGADAIVHLAAISRDQDCRRDPAQAFDINVGGTLNLVRAAKARGVKQFIFASSEWVYGEVENGGTQKEDSVIDAGRIISEYALTKLAGERLLSMAHSQGSCPVTLLRFGIVYGPRPANWSAVEMLFNAVRSQDEVEVKGSLQTARRFIHVSDIAAGIIKALGRTSLETFNLSGDRLVTLQEIIQTSALLLSRKPNVVERQPQAVSIRNPDNTKARQILGWRPAVELKEGLSSLLPAATGNP